MSIILSMLVVPAIFIADLLIGDPVYALHPIRIMGRVVLFFEKHLFARGLNNRIGGVLLVIAMALLFVLPVWGLHRILWAAHSWAGFIWDLYWGFHCIALRDLVTHAGRIGKAVESGDLPRARIATSMLVGRDTEPMDEDACCRAGIESLSENWTDGVIAPLFWLVLLGVPGMVFFKIVSTLDSMVGYKNERYFYFGWAGARLDDLMNYVPARITWILTWITAAFLPGFSPAKAFRVGLEQHALAPGPNSGWSEAAFAGALELRIAGPIWKGGVMVTDIWLGDPSDRSDAKPRDLVRAFRLAYTGTILFLLCSLPLWLR